MNSRIIGNGTQGYVVRPPINLTDENFVGKLGLYNNLINEYNMAQKFHPEGPYQLNPIKLEKINSEDVELITNVFKNSDVYQLVIPYIHGKSLNIFFDNNGIYVDSVNNWIDQLKALLFLQKEIQLFNSLGLYHNDIDTSNIIYNDFEKKMYLIDFGLASIYDEDVDEDESSNICNIISSLLFGMLNRIPVKEWILNNNICTLKYEKLYYMFENTLKRDQFGTIVGLNFKKYKNLPNNRGKLINDTQNFINNNSEIDIIKYLFDIELKVFPVDLNLDNLNIALINFNK